MSHNEEWGADYYAHLGDPFSGSWPAPGPGYVVDRASLLAASQGLPEDVCHEYVEAGIDLLLDQEFPALAVGELLTAAAVRRDRQVPLLLVRSYADVPGSTWLTIRALEGAFRSYLAVYGEGLALPIGQDDAALAAGLAALHGLTLQDSAACLAAAKVLCQDPQAHYLDALAATITLVGEGSWP
jgi:hypothetical protein